jgi:MFS family permease
VKRLPLSVILLGVTSFFTDVSSEMIFPLLPLFLSDVLHANPAFLGLVEGAADTVASLLKLVSGRVSDRLERRKGLVLVGYGLSGAVRPLVAWAGAPWHVLGVRLTDRVGKGLRSSPRDALIADAAPPGETGRAFGFHSAMDHAGAVLGPLVATVMMHAGADLRTVFAWASVPALLAFVALLFVRESRAAARAPEASTSAPLPRSMWGLFGIIGLFALGNSSDAFLLLRAREAGVEPAWIPLLWTAFHVSKFSSSYVFGAWSDRLARWRLVAAGWGVYALAYLGFAAAEQAWHAWAVFVFYGLFYGLVEPAQKAMVKDLSPPELRGRAFGAYHFVVGIAALPAGLLTGALWHAYGPAVALSFGAALSGLSCALLLVWRARATSSG